MVLFFSLFLFGYIFLVANADLDVSPSNALIVDDTKLPSSPDSIEGLFKGYFTDNNDNRNYGNCVLWINSLESVQASSSDSQHADKNLTSSTSNNDVVLSSPNVPRHKLMITTADFRQEWFSFWYSVYDQHHGVIFLSNHNFSYNTALQNYSFIDSSTSSSSSSSSNHASNASLFSYCTNMAVIRFKNTPANDDGVKRIISGQLHGCKYNLTFSDLAFMDKQTFEHKANEYGIVSLTVVSIAFFFLFKQLEYSSTLGRVSRLSFTTLYLQFIYNGIICFLHFQIATQIESLFTTLFTTSFICIMNANLYTRLMTSIWAMRYDMSNPNLLRLFHFLKIFSFIAILVLAQCIVNGQYTFLIFLLLSSDWLFQIAHNIRSGQVASWRHHTLLCTTATKLFYPLYLYGCPSNLVGVPTNAWCVWLLVLWSALQVMLIYTQDRKLNARWFVPQALRPKHYKYHKAPNYNIDEFDEDTESESDVSDMDTSEDDDSRRDDGDTAVLIRRDVEAPNSPRTRDKKKQKKQKQKKEKIQKQCAICLEHINWKKEYEHIMVTPCQHWFHDDCLSTWMQQRLNCPTCRAQLPPLC